MNEQIAVTPCVVKVLLCKSEDIVKVATLVRGAEIRPRKLVVWEPGKRDNRGVGMAL